MGFDRGRVPFLAKKNVKSFGGSIREAQIKWCPLTPSPTQSELYSFQIVIMRVNYYILKKNIIQIKLNKMLTRASAKMFTHL